MTKARQLADLGNKTSLDEINDAYDAGALSNRNLIINGGLLCWQRGTSHSVSGGIVYTADRFWKYSPSVSGTYERSTDAPDGFAYSMHYNVDGSTAGSGTTVEFSRQGYFLQGQYTFSFYVKGDLTNTNLGIGFRNSVGSGTNEVNFSPITNYGNYTEWTRVVRTFTINLAPHANNKFLNLEFAGMPAGVKFTGVQLEVGDTATPFEHKNVGQEILACQRYFQKLNTTGSSSRHMLGAGHFNTGTQLVIPYQHYGGIMRANPTGSVSAMNLFDIEPFDDAPTSVIFSVTTTHGCFITVTSPSTRTVGDAGSLFLDTAGAYISFDAEL